MKKLLAVILSVIMVFSFAACAGKSANNEGCLLYTSFITKDLSKCDWVCTWKGKSVRFESPQPVSLTLDGEYGGEHTEIDVYKGQI